MAELLTNVVCGDNYTAPATLGPALDIQQLVFQVFNEPIYARFYKPQVGDDNRAQPTQELQEHYFPVGTLLSVDGAAGVQFRNAIAGQNATVNAEIAFVGDPIFDFQSSGLFSAAVLTLSFLHNNALIGAENALDFEDSSSIVWTVTDTPGTKEAVSAAFVSGSVVTSVFGRSGPAVVAVSGDYTAAQVTNAADKASASAQIFAGNVSTGPSGFAAPTSTLGTVLIQAGSIANVAATSTTNIFTSVVGNGTDTSSQFLFRADGRLAWGPGTATQDVFLARDAAGAQLDLTGAFQASGNVYAATTVTNAIGSPAGALLNSGGVLQVSRAIGNVVFTVTNPSATTDWRFQIAGDGGMKWAAANTAADVTITRTAPGVLSLGGTGGGNLFTAGSTTTINTTGNFNVDAATEWNGCLSNALIAAITITVVNPLHPPTTSQTASLYLKFRNTSGAFVVSLSWGAAYRSTGSVTLPASVPVSTQTVLQFQWDPDQSLWQLVTRIQ